MVTSGRGAWTSTGMPTRSIFYELTSPAVGSTPERNDDFRSVTLGVKAYQSIFNKNYGKTLVTDGWWGAKTTEAAKDIQTKLKIGNDGVVGPVTSKALILPITKQLEEKYSLLSGVLCGLCKQESAFDLGAVGFKTNSDKGVVQINIVAHSTITEAQAFDPFFALDYAADRLKKAYAKYLRWDCAVASYNSPLWANQWAQTGTAPNAQIGNYATTVLAGC